MAKWNKWLFAGALLFLVAVIVATYYNWQFLHGGTDSPAQTIRNIGLLVGGAIALVIAWWRGIINTEQEQTAKRVLKNDRNQKALELLGNSASPVRRAALFALLNVAQEDPREHAAEVLDLCRHLAVNREAIGIGDSELTLIGHVADIMATTVSRLDWA